MEQYRLRVSEMQCQKRRANSFTGPHETHQKARQAPQQPGHPYPPCPRTLPKLETVPRPRLLVRRADLTNNSPPAKGEYRVAGRGFGNVRGRSNRKSPSLELVILRQFRMPEPRPLRAFCDADRGWYWFHSGCSKRLLPLARRPVQAIGPWPRVGRVPSA